MPFLSDAGIGARVAEPIAAAAHDSEEDQSMDPDDARDYADQFPYPDDPDSPGRAYMTSYYDIQYHSMISHTYI